MKKKGFTLIELLAVIVILAVLMVIAVPKILDVIENSRKSAVKSSAELYIDAIEKNNAIANVDSNASKIADGQNMDTRLLNVKVKGTKPKYGTISIEKGKVTNANLCIDGYNVIFENRNATVLTEPCDMENIPEYALFDGNGVDSPAPIMKKEGEKLGTLPVLTREGYEFLGWFTALTGGDKITEETVMPLGGATYYAQWQKVEPLCQRATTLHTSGSTTYGNDPTTRVEKVLEVGDAFDCDVDGSGEFEDDERFYYINDYYNTSTKQFETDKAVLIYYNNVSGITSYNEGSGYAWYGPVTAAKHLPKTDDWTNVNLINPVRQLLNENGDTSIPYSYETRELVQFDYTEYSARFLTTQELVSACNITLTGSDSYPLSSCPFLLENTGNNINYWLETPVSTQYNIAFEVYGYSSILSYTNVNTTAYYAPRVRPVIEIPKSRIIY